MVSEGSFGYKIGRKIRLMHVQYDANLLWQTCVREIFILMKHYGSIDLLRQAFENLKEAKNSPKQVAIEKCKPYTDIEVSNKSRDDWDCLTHFCQHSFINILDSGYFLNNGSRSGLIFLLDFNINSVRFYGVNYDKTEIDYDKATIDEIMEFDEMPTKSMTEILIDTKERSEKYNRNLKCVDEEIEKIENIIKRAKELGGDQNILQQANKLLYDMKLERKKLEMDYNYFYHRLDALNLINYDTNNDDKHN
jgi:hypothetical protein